MKNGQDQEPENDEGAIQLNSILKFMCVSGVKDYSEWVKERNKVVSSLTEQERELLSETDIPIEIMEMEEEPRRGT